MERTNRIGLVVTSVGAVSLMAQFIIAFTRLLTDQSIDGQGVVALAIHVAPYVLLLIGLYLLFSKKKTLGVENRLGRIAITAIASWSLAGAVFLITVVLALVARGGEGVEMVFSYLAAISVVLTICFFPFVYRRLH